MRISIDGFESLRRGIDGFDDKLRQVLRETAKEGAEIVAEAARERVPVKTGKLKSSIGTKEFRQIENGAVFDAGYVNTDQFGDKNRYFVWHEMGSSHEKPKRPLRKAKNSKTVRLRVRALFEQKLSQVINQGGGDNGSNP